MDKSPELPNFARILSIKVNPVPTVATPTTFKPAVLTFAVFAIPVKADPSPLKLVAVTIPAKVAFPTEVTVPPTPAAPNLIPLLAVIKPTASTLVTSS